MDNGLHPEECDVVMEGGITSGVVYPAFIVGLSRHFRLRSIGGASVGSVAAVAAAAAQFRRNAGRAAPEGSAAADPFDKLEGLGAWLQDTRNGKTNLFRLFQPCGGLAQHFATLVMALNAPSRTRAVLRFARAMMLRFVAGWIVAALLVLLMLRLLPDGGPGVWFFTLALAIVGCLLGSLVQFLWSGWRGMRDNRFGICSGLRNAASQPPALTEWLHDYVQDLAGLPHDAPLTFGQLKHSDKPIELVLMTTGVSELSAHQLPYKANDLAFRRSDLVHLFPEAVVDWLVKHESTGHGKDSLAVLAALDPQAATGQRDVYYMPSGDDLPVVVAARMSLSFPVLLQAVPLLRLRYYDNPAKDGGRFDARTVWFSDGGLTNNFPIHLFDQLLPSRPTFGVVLSNTLRESDHDSGDDHGQRVTVAENNALPSLSYAPIGDPHVRPGVFMFFHTMLSTIRTWRHEALRRTPGFRDRVVIIKHTRGEGGLNLNMPRESIARMSASGALAAARIVSRFRHDDRSAIGWINHRFVRMRTTAALLHNTLVPVAEAMETDVKPGYADLWQARGADQLSAYRLGEEQQAEGLEFFRRLVHAVAAAKRGRFNDEGGPSPMPSLMVAPKET